MSVFFMTITNVIAKDVSSEITKAQSGNVLGCITRLEIYAAQTKNMFDVLRYFLNSCITINNF